MPFWLYKSNHTTRSVKYTKKTNAYIIIPTPNNNTISKMSKSLTKNSINSFNNYNINKENSMQNKKIHKSNINSIKIYKPFGSTGANYNGLLNHKKQKSSNEFKSMFDNKKTQFKNSAEKPKKMG